MQYNYDDMTCYVMTCNIIIWTCNKIMLARKIIQFACKHSYLTC